MKYQVKPEDLVQQIRDFPIEVVQKMVDYQDKPDVTIFQEHATASENRGGFDWDKSIEGSHFWDDIIIDKEFPLFFEMYPKEVKPEVTDVTGYEQYKGKDFLFNGEILTCDQIIIFDDDDVLIRTDENRFLPFPSRKWIKQII